VELLVVKLKERALDCEVALGLPTLDLVENETEDSGNDSDLVFSEPHRAARAHSEGLSRASLSVSNERGIEAVKAPQDHVLGSGLEHLFLLTLQPEDRVELEVAA